MRISDWSSDVCSSDLSCWTTIWADCNDAGFSTVSLTFMADDAPRSVEVDTVGPGISMFRRDTILHPEVFAEITSPRFPKTDDMAFGIARSEEHTSELQSLMRISYAVFCLKKKK